MFAPLVEHEQHNRESPSGSSLIMGHLLPNCL